jgi:hypothetical protein
MCCTANPGLIYDSVAKVCVLNTSTTLDSSATDTTTSTTDTTTSTTDTTTDTTTTESMKNMNSLLRPTAYQNW